MGRGYSDDLRARVIQHVESGASRRETARLFSIGNATAVRWFQRWSNTNGPKRRPAISGQGPRDSDGSPRSERGEPCGKRGLRSGATSARWF